MDTTVMDSQKRIGGNGHSIPVDEVAALSLFAGMSRDTVAGLLVDAEAQFARRDTLLYRGGDPADRLYLLLSGKVALMFPSPNERETIIDIVGPEMSFAEVAIFDDEVYLLDARVIEDAELVVVPAERFRQQLDENFELVRGLVLALCSRMRSMVGQLGELKGKTTAQRVGGFLLQLAEVDKGSAEVRLPYEKRLLAGRLGMKPESLSRALTKLRTVGVVGHDEILSIEDIPTLRDFCRGNGGAARPH